MDKEFYVPDRDYLTTHRQEAGEQASREKKLTEGQDDLFRLFQDHNKQLNSVGRQSDTNKQGREVNIDEAEALDHLKTIASISTRAYGVYERLLNQTMAGEKLNPEYAGLARELARMVLPTNYYSQWYWKIDLHNLLHFISLRADQHAQHEIREYAKVIGDIVRQWVPLTWEAFVDYRLNGMFLSQLEAQVVRKLLKGEQCKFSETGLTKREWKELAQKLQLDLPSSE